MNGWRKADTAVKINSVSHSFGMSIPFMDLITSDHHYLTVLQLILFGKVTSIFLIKLLFVRVDY
jgi:hypothetical protein